MKKIYTKNNVLISQTLSKIDTVSDKDIVSSYKEQHLNPLELLRKFKSLLNNSEIWYIIPKDECDFLIEECSNWFEDNLIIMENDI